MLVNVCEIWFRSDRQQQQQHQRPHSTFGARSMKLIEHSCSWPSTFGMPFEAQILSMSVHKKYEIKLNREKQRVNGLRSLAAMKVRHFLSLFFMDNSNHFLRLRSTGEHWRRTLKLLNQLAAYPFAKRTKMPSKANSFRSWVSNVFPFSFSYQTGRNRESFIIIFVLCFWRRRSRWLGTVHGQVSNVSQRKLI